MEITGTIIVALPEVSGISKSTGNPWKKREYVLENTDGQYPRKMCFTCFGDNADRINLTVPKGKKDEIKAHAESLGESVNGYLWRLIQEDMARNKEG